MGEGIRWGDLNLEKKPLNLEKKPAGESIDLATTKMLLEARRAGMETAWDRLNKQHPSPRSGRSGMWHLASLRRIRTGLISAPNAAEPSSAGRMPGTVSGSGGECEAEGSGAGATTETTSFFTRSNSCES
jgi:hypothetical protein